MLRSVIFWSCVKCLLQFFFLTYRNIEKMSHLYVSILYTKRSQEVHGDYKAGWKYLSL